VGYTAAVPPNPRSHRTASRPYGVRGSGGDEKWKPAVARDKAVLTRKRAPGCFQDSVGHVSFLSDMWKRELNVKLSQLPATSAVTSGPTHLIMVPQTGYRCPTRQGDWVKEASIEFGGIKLTDAADRAYPGPRGHDDKVLKYKDAGSSIQCRLIVRRSPQPSQTRRLTLFSQFSEKEIGRSKVGFTGPFTHGDSMNVIARS